MEKTTVEPEKAQQTQQPQQTQATPAGTPPAGTEPQEYLGGRFKDPRDMEKAYSELEKEFTRRRQMLSEYERKLQELARASQQPTQTQQQTDPNELFWTNPIEVMNRQLMQTLEPLAGAFIETQKDKYRSNADFAKLEPEIDYILSNYPNLKMQPNIIGNLYKMVKGLHLDEGDYERQLREKIQAETQGKITTAMETGGAPAIPSGQTKVSLTAEEKAVAHKFYPDLTPDKAEEVYLKWKR